MSILIERNSFPSPFISGFDSPVNPDMVADVDVIAELFSQTINPFFAERNPPCPLMGRVVIDDLSNPVCFLLALILLSVTTAARYITPDFLLASEAAPASDSITPNRIPESAARYLNSIRPRREEAAPARPSNQEDSESHLRSDYGISANEDDLWTGIVESNNNQRFENAKRNNTDGKAYLKSVINDHKEKLSADDKAAFSQQLEESDPDIFLKVPELAVKQAVTSSEAPTTQNTPAFLHQHLSKLNELHQQNASNPTSLAQGSGDTWKGVGAIATGLARDPNFIGAMSQALEG